MPMVLQKLMRHDSIETTLRYYVDLDADEMAEELWKTMPENINTFINTPSLRTQERRKGARLMNRRNSFSDFTLFSAEGKGVEPSTACAAPDFESAGNLENAWKTRGFRVHWS